MEPPKLSDREDAIQFVQQHLRQGREFYWSEETRKLEMRPRLAGPSVLKILTELLRVESREDWQAVRAELGMARTRQKTWTKVFVQRSFPVREEKERTEAFRQIEAQAEPRCPYCRRDFKTQNAVKGHVTKHHLGKDWIWYGP